MAQSVKRLTFRLSLGLYLRVMSSSPALGTAWSLLKKDREINPDGVREEQSGPVNSEGLVSLILGKIHRPHREKAT